MWISILPNVFLHGRFPSWFMHIPELFFSAIKPESDPQSGDFPHLTCVQLTTRRMDLSNALRRFTSSFYLKPNSRVSFLLAFLFGFVFFCLGSTILASIFARLI